MSDVSAWLASAFDLLLVVVGFGLVIVVHELGHFAAARWAGIRVLAFAVGFGPAAMSYRRGLGWRRGSSEPEYAARTQRGELPPGASPTEYRFNWLPFGGYVKMLGQEDANPGAVSTFPDSYQSAPVWKRMIVISAGVVMNIILAVVLFVVVFMAGLRTEPAKIGDVEPGSPASRAVAANAESAGVREPGLLPGDELTLINGAKPETFQDLVLATAMSRAGEAIRLRVARPGVTEPLQFEIVPQVSPLSGLLEIGVGPARSVRVATPVERDDAARFRVDLDRLGLAGVEPGMILSRAGAAELPTSGAALLRAMRASGGAPVELEFAHTATPVRAGAEPPVPDGRRVTIHLVPKAELQIDLVERPGQASAVIEHLLGLMPVMRVVDAAEGKAAWSQGLRSGDIFARLGSVEYPSLLSGIAEIQGHKGRTISAVVLRATPTGTEEVALTLKVTSAGRVGFTPGDTVEESTLLALPPERVRGIRDKAESRTTPARAIFVRPGMRVLLVNGQPVDNFPTLRAALQVATSDAFARQSDALVRLLVRMPASVPGVPEPEREIEWSIPAPDVSALHALGWRSPVGMGLFDPEQFKLRGRDPFHALRLGISETHRVMMMTYTTFLRLIEGTVKVEHLKGPVGIAHVGTILAGKGLVWLLFFLGLISVNLAVVNFLPLPIVDGGQFLFLAVEQVRGKPAPISVQNAATLAGLVLIGSLFLIVTFNDVMRLLP